MARQRGAGLARLGLAKGTPSACLLAPKASAWRTREVPCGAETGGVVQTPIAGIGRRLVSGATLGALGVRHANASRRNSHGRRPCPCEPEASRVLLGAPAAAEGDAITSGTERWRPHEGRA